MKISFWSTYINQLLTAFHQNVVYSTLLVIVVALTPVSVAFLSWYQTEVPAKLVWKDPKAYPHKYKNRVSYRYYASFYFDEIKSNKMVEIQETTHSNAKIGDVYLFSRQHKLQTGWYNTFMFLGIANFSVTAIFLIGFVCNFISVANSYFSVKKKDTSYPYPD